MTRPMPILLEVPSRPALRYRGGKWRIAPWIISHFPEHECYVEPYAGGASVLLVKPPSKFEVLNDLDGRVVNFWRVLREPRLNRQFRQQLLLTPYSRDEYKAAHEPSDDPVEAARRFYVACFQGFGRGYAAGGFALQVGSYGWGKNRPRQLQAVKHLRVIRRRLAQVQLENRPALDVIARCDRPGTLFYLDPPYVHDTRLNSKRLYHHEMNDEDHRQLLAVLPTLQGMVVLSGYDHPIYSELLAGWRREERTTNVERQREVTECLWISPAAERNRKTTQTDLLFAGEEIEGVK